MRWLLAGMILLRLIEPRSAKADFITATLAVTNVPANGATIADGADVRTWTTGSITTPGTQIPVLNCACITTNIDAASNLWNQVAGTRFPLINATWDGSTSNVIFTGQAPLVLTVSAGWCKITYVTNTTVDSLLVAVPLSNFAPSNQLRMANGMVDGINAYATDAFTTNAAALQNYVSTNVPEFVWGKTNIGGALSNALAVSITPPGTNTVALRVVFPATGGTQTNYVVLVTDNAGNVLFSVTGQGVVFAGGAFLIPGTLSAGGLHISGFSSLDSLASMDAAQATNGFFAPGFSAHGTSDLTEPPVQIVGTNGLAANVLEVYRDYFSTLDFNITSNGVTHARVMTATEYSNLVTSAQGTNKLLGVVTFPRYNNTALANGNNAAVNPGTNTYFKVSGPTGAFTINGIVGGTDGRILLLQNSTGQTMTIANDSGVDSTPANRILMPTGGDTNITGNPGLVMFVYDTGLSHWIYKP